MNPLTERWKTLPIPEPLDRRPRDERGLPVPASVWWNPATGKYDFRVLDPTAPTKLIAMDACHLCGFPLERTKFFIGGPACMKSRCFVDGPLHESCARYALQVCPFLAAPNARYSETYPESTDTLIINVNETMLPRPDKFGLMEAQGYRRVLIAGQQPALEALGAFVREWWQHGECVEVMQNVVFTPQPVMKRKGK